MAKGAAASPQLGLKSIAMFEAAKGALVILAGIGLVALLHRDAQALAEAIVSRFHINPASRYPTISCRCSRIPRTGASGPSAARPRCTR